MNSHRTIGRNIALVLFGDMTTYILSFIYFTFSARYFGVSDFGILSLAMALTSMTAIIVNFGIDPFIIREVAIDESSIPSMINTSVFIKFIFSIIGAFMLNFYLWVLNYEHNILLITNLIFISILINSIISIFDSIFQGLQKTVYFTYNKIANAFLLTVSLFIIIKLNLSLISFACIYPLISFILLLNYMRAVKKYVRINLKLNLEKVKSVIEESLPFTVNFAFLGIFSYTDTLMISIFMNEYDVGCYSVAYKIVTVLLFVPLAFNVAIYPVLSKHFVSNNSRQILINIINKYFLIMLMVGLPLAIGTTFLSDEIILLVFGHEYLKSIQALKILIWFSFLVYLHSPFSKLFASINKQMIVAKITGFSAILNVCLNYILIPQYSLNGASFATLISEIFIFSSLFYMAWKLGYFKITINTIYSTIKIIICCLIMVYILTILKNWDLFIRIMISTLVYISSIIIIKFFSKKEMLLLRSIILK